MKIFWNLRYLLAIMAMPVVTACSSDDPVTPTPTPDPTPDPTPTVTWTDVTATPDSWDNQRRADMTYQLLVYAFADSNNDGIGDFNGITAKLDYISKLGVKAIWLSPIHPADSYHGYDVTDYTAVNPAYGTMDDFKTLVTTAYNQYGIKIYLDYVLNHTGKGHPWLSDALSNESSPYRNFYFINETGGDNYHAYVAPSVNNVKLKMTLDWGTTKTVTVSKTTEENVEGDGGIWVYFGDNNMKEFKKTGDTTYEVTFDYQSEWGFLIRTDKDKWDSYKYGAPKDQQINLDEPFTLTNDNANDIVFKDSKTIYYYGAFGSWMPDLNYGTDPTKAASNSTYQALLASAKGWLDLGVRGLRLDAVKHIYGDVVGTENDNPKFLKVWYDDLNAYYKSLGTNEDLYMVGECLVDNATTIGKYYAGLPAMFEFPFWYRMQWALNESTGRYFAKDILGYQSSYSSVNPNYIEATKLSNHDEERTAYVLNGNINRCKQAAAILLTAQGHPYIYYGEELASNPKNSKDSGDEYVRGPLPWGDSYTTDGAKYMNKSVSANTDDVTTQENTGNSILNVYRQFAQLRNTYPALAEGAMSKHGTYNEDNGTFNNLAAWYMTKDSQKILVLHNLGSSQLDVPVTDTVDKAIATLGTVQQNSTTYRLGANSSVVLLLK